MVDLMLRFGVMAVIAMGVLQDPTTSLPDAYKVQFENIVRNILDTTDRVVEIQVAAIYSSGNTTSRPDVFEVRFRTDAGDWRRARFINKF